MSKYITNWFIPLERYILLSILFPKALQAVGLGRENHSVPSMFEELKRIPKDSLVVGKAGKVVTAASSTLVCRK